MPNRVAWTNADEFGHTVTSKDGYAGVISVKFDSNIQLGRLIKPGETFEFTFAKVGEFSYSCVPHPHMQGKIEIVPDFS